jgi:hypothetical protein
MWMTILYPKLHLLHFFWDTLYSKDKVLFMVWLWDLQSCSHTSR